MRVAHGKSRRAAPKPSPAKDGQARRAGGRKGFTFTLSVVMIALTLISVASFAQEWRKGQQASYTEILPSESMRLQERVATDIGQIVRADASVKTGNASSTTLSLSTQQPFKREGEPLAKIADYSSSLPSNLRNLGYEAVLEANGLAGSNATVIVTSQNGSLVQSNLGAYDITTFYQPTGFVPGTIYASISCGKQASSVGELSAASSSGGDGAGQYYVVNYTEPSGRSYLRNYYAAPNSDTTMRITYPDSTLLYFDSRFSPAGRNTTSIHYTKSSSGALILPFNQNATGVVRDYSLFRENVTIAEGESAPLWKSDCSRGGCYQFDGTGDYMFVPGGVGFTDAEIPLPLGSEKVSDPWFETFGGEPSPNDGAGDEWYYWHIENGGANDIFDAASGAGAQSYYSVRAIAISGSAGDSDIYQGIPGISPSTPYALSFWSMSNGSNAGRYRLEIQPDPLNGVEKQCLESDGATWSTACNSYFPVALSPGAYSRTSREFMAPAGPSPSASYTVPLTLIIRLYPPYPSGEAYYDSASLKQSAGANGGFESYYAEGGTLLPQN
jgi:hypothetical protein